MNIFMDIDGFFLPLPSVKNIFLYMYTRRKYRMISFEKEPEPNDTLFQQYYLGFRSAMFICEDSVESEDKVLKALNDYREACMEMAMKHMINHVYSKQSLAVDFMWITREAIINELRKGFPEVKKVKLQLSMKPRLSANIVAKNTIVFPALVRTMLNHCNMVIVNSIYRAMDEDGDIVGDIEDRKQIARWIFPYLLYCHDDISVRNLPIIGAHSEDALKTSFRLTNLQMTFIFAHEYAHILLKHYDSKVNEYMEEEADAFALQIVIAYGEKSGSFSKLEILTALRWLFKYQHLEYLMGTIVQRRPIEYHYTKLEERRGKVQVELLKNYGLRGSTLFETAGFIMLVELEEIISEYGSKLIDNILNSFHESKTTGGIEPWWEIIEKK